MLTPLCHRRSLMADRSNLCFGAMSFGANVDEYISKAKFKRCRKADINFFDTADMYSGGQSKEILGECISDCRDEIVLATNQACSRRQLRRLKTDRIDFYFVQRFMRTS
jgi:aryl-alcohol dehydrogenase-like predicted oxidoreductase